jgi:hypothetical protein
MRSKSRLAAILLAAGLGLTLACAAALRHPTPQDTMLLASRWPGTTVKDLERGRKLYVRRCSGCHHLFLPRAFPKEKWPGLVDDMAQKARLDPGDRDDLVRFLVAVASDGAIASDR